MIQQLKLDKVDNEKDLQMEVKREEQKAKDQINQMAIRMKSAKEDNNKLLQGLEDQKEELKLL